jgi:hypothetical protein
MKRIEIHDPLVIMFKDDEDTIITHIHPPEDYTPEDYGLLICDLVRHLAKALKIEEDDIWEWVDKEREHPTSTLSSPS